jgi:hypothetical protein
MMYIVLEEEEEGKEGERREEERGGARVEKSSREGMRDMIMRDNMAYTRKTHTGAVCKNIPCKILQSQQNELCTT